MKIVEAEARCLKVLEECKALEVYDQECSHINADDALCELLKLLGMVEVVIEYEKLERWFS